MLLLLFQIGADRYALDTSSVLEIVPRVTLRRVPGATPGLAGLLEYHGAAVPVLDLRELVSGQPAASMFSTRLVLVRAPLSPAADGRPPVMGLLVERATGTIQRRRTDFVETHLRVPGAPYLGPVIPDAEGFIQFVEIDGLLGPSVRAMLGGGRQETRPPETVFLEGAWS